MNLGNMNTRIRIKQPTVTRGAAGGSYESYTTYKDNVWAWKKQRNAGERFQASQLVAEVVAEFHCHYISGITETMIIEEIDSGDTFEINGIHPGTFRQDVILLASKKDFD